MTPNPATTVRLSESELDEIRTLIEQRSAILFDASRERFFSTRLLDFIEEKHLASGTDLLRHIKSSSIEYESLLEQLLTQETSFFRYPAVYEALEKRIVPEIEERKFWENPRVLRIWSAGCSTGEEPYTLAMVLAEYFGTTRNFNIFATDLCTQVLWVARQAVYSNDLGKSIPPALRQKYTLNGHGSQAGRFRIVPELRERVTFEYINLIAPDWQIPGAMNVIFCRNVMIYFDLKTRSRIVGRFRRHLKPDGHLFIGHAETLNGIDRAIGFVQVRPTVYALQP
jgi:chemotaxis protein methyltransferase CheR